MQGIRSTKQNEILLLIHPEIYGLSGYLGCPYDCSWSGRWGRAVCGAKENVAFNGYNCRGYPADWVEDIEYQWRHPLIIENAVELLQKELPVKQPSRVVMADASDPYPWPLERDLKLTRRLIAGIDGLPITVLTKCPTTLPQRDFDLLREKGSSWFGITLWQEEATAQKHQIKVLREAKRQDLSTFCSLSPWLPGKDDPRHLISSLQDIVDYFLVLTLNSRGLAVDPSWYEAHLPSFVAWIVREGLEEKVYLDRLLLSAAGVKYYPWKKRPEPWQWAALGLANTFLGLKVSIFIITIDHFATLTEQYDYSTMNRIFREVPALLKNNLQPPDTLSPGEGVYHVLLAPQTEANAARIKGEELCALVRQHRFLDEEQISLTASIGIATFPTHGQTVEAIMSNALIALDRARVEGGDQGVLYSDDLTNDIGAKWPWKLMCDTPPFGISDCR